MKQRFSSLDVKVIAHELNAALTNLRVSNIYDLSSRIFLLKCAKPGNKAQLLVDSGFRCHLTSFSRTANPAPSAFVSRLRKYLKSRRITGVRQLGTDRVIEISFSDGQYIVYLEFFAAGNIVLTDGELNVLALLRQVSEGNEDVDVRLGGRYVLDAKQNYHGIPELDKERLRSTLETQVQRVKIAQEAGGKSFKRKKGGDNLKKALSIGFPEFPPHLLDHVFTQAGIDTNIKADEALQTESRLDQIISALKQARQIITNLESQERNKGYIIAKEKTASTEKISPQGPDRKQDRENILYEDFHPFRPSQFEHTPQTHILEIDGFNRTVDEFYSSIESQRLESRLTEKEEAARKKLESAKNEHEKRLGVLQQQQELHIRKAEAIEANTHRVDEAVAAVNGLVGQGMDWEDMGKLIENEQKRNNVVAQMIKLPLKLHENTVTLLLEEPGAEEESDEDYESEDPLDSDEETIAASEAKTQPQQDKRLSIDIDLGISSWSNARQYYDQKKQAAVKEHRTVQASDKALKAMEKKIGTDLKKGLKQEKDALRPARRTFWFEKFLYFISSDGYLVLGGKDIQQNEMLYRRYLKKGDVYVHADLPGAASVIVKNHPTNPDEQFPPSTLSQAGALSVCTSNAWDSKAVMAAWWVNADQVSKTAPTGEYINVGGFVIKGKKNFLPPTQLILGFAIAWLISPESRANHGKHRFQQPEGTLNDRAGHDAANIESLSIDDEHEHGELSDQNPADVIPDVEDVADDAAVEVTEDKGIGNATVAIEDHDEDDGKSVTSVAASEQQEDRGNPLQTRQTTTKDSDPEIVDEDENENEESETAEAEDTSQVGESQPDENPDALNPSQSTISSSLQSQHPKHQKPKRGANTKAKRAAREKYALQSDEEREIAMSLLGSTKGEQKRVELAEARAAKEEKVRVDKERRRAQHEKHVEAEKRRNERLEKGELVAEVDQVDAEQVEQERQELLNIDLLVPYPETGDEIIAAMPVVAPWTALARNKFKVKLQPGSVKKGKAVKEIVANWTALGTRVPKVVDESNRDKEKVWRREVECIKHWKVEEIFGVIPVRGVRIVQSGGGSGGGGGNSGGGGAGKNKGHHHPARGSKKK